MARPVRRADLTKTVLVPGGDDAVRSFVERESPVPVDVVARAERELGAADVAILVVEAVDDDLRAAVAAALRSRATIAVLVRRDVWSAGGSEIQRVLDQIQRDPRHKLVRFWRDRGDLERTIRDDVFTLDASALVAEGVPDGTFVKVGSTFEQWWELQNCGFVPWEGRVLRELATDGLVAAAQSVAVAPTAPGAIARVEVQLTAPAEPGAYRSLWKMADADGSLLFPSAPGVWCQVLAVY